VGYVGLGWGASLSPRERAAPGPLRAGPARGTIEAVGPADLIDAAFELGLDAAGLAPLAPPADAPRLWAWLAAGRHAGMGWIERQAPRIADPRGLVAGPGLLLVVSVSHARPAVRLTDGARIARYAAGRDYHRWLGKRLKKLARRFERGSSRAIVDAGPLLERSHGAEAGLGFRSKAANLLSRPFGPWFFLGELAFVWRGEAPELGRARLAADSHMDLALGSCGSCRACIDACPTQAILAPGEVDAGRCISYHTIENRGPAPAELRASFGAWVFGCDVCSEVCPYGQRAADQSERFGTHKEVAEGSLQRFLAAGRGAAPPLDLTGSPLGRAGGLGLARNAAVALGNLPSEAGRAELLAALESAEPLLREAAAWALAQGYGRDLGVAAALERAQARESEAWVALALAGHRERAGAPPA
jgi:epoxyqueuosine reductase